MSSSRSPRWTLRETDVDGWQALVRQLDLHPIVARILARRGFDDPERAERFLNPSLADMHDPFSMADMDRAVETIVDTLESEGSIALHGDYDVDGITSTSLLYDFFDGLGVEVDYLVPHRIEDGYGLSPETIDRLAEGEPDLLITADCGVTAGDAIARAREHGMDVVVVDHHSVTDALPEADAILDPHRPDCDFPFEGLSAVGLAFNLVVAVRSALRERGAFENGDEPDLRHLLDLVALGTVADLVPLRDENRLFATFGLELMSSAPRPGLRALIDEACDSDDEITAQTIGYKLGPRLNAAGRIDDATMCVELLTTSDARRARQIASRLEALNDERREMQRALVDEAMGQGRQQVDEGARIVVVDGEGWHQGLLGIVAGRLSDAFHRPAIALNREDGVAQGSARSIDGVNLVELLGDADELLEEYGGHAAAAGLELASDDVPELRQRLNEVIEPMLEAGELPRPRIEIEESVQLDDLEPTFVRDLHRLRPFGQEHPEPVFVCREMTSRDSKIVGTDHLRAEFSDGSAELGGIGFSMGESIDLLDEPVAVAFVPRYTYFRGEGRLEMHLRDLCPASDTDARLDESS